ELAAQALVAFVAGQHRRDDHQVAHRKTLQPFTDLGDVAGKLMPADERHLVRALDQHTRQVRPANTDRGDAHHRAVVEEPRGGDVFQADVPGSVEYCCAHHYSCSNLNFAGGKRSSAARTADRIPPCVPSWETYLARTSG